MNRDMKTHLLLAFYIPSILIMMAFGVLVPVLPVYAGNLTDSFILVGVLLSSQYAGQLLLDLPAGVLLRRIGVKRAMLLGTGLGTLGTLMLLPATNIWWATLALTVAGAGLAIYGVARHTYITTVTAAHIRGRAIALFGGTLRMGRFFGPVIGGAVAGAFGLRAAFGVFILLTLGTAYFVWRYMPDANANEQSSTPYEHMRLGQTLRENRDVFVTAGTGQIFAQLTRVGWQWAIPLYADDVLGLSVEVIGLVVGVGGLFDALLFYTSGVIMDRFGRKWAIVPSFALQGVGLALIPLTGGALTLGAVSALIGAANALSSGTMMTLGGDFAPPASRSEFLGTWRFIGDIGFGAGPLVLGGIASALALQPAVWVMAGFGFGTAVWFSALVPETLERKRVTAEVGD